MHEPSSASSSFSKMSSFPPISPFERIYQHGSLYVYVYVCVVCTYRDRGFPLSRAFKRSTQLGKALRASSFIHAEHAACSSLSTPVLERLKPIHGLDILNGQLRSRSRVYRGYGSKKTKSSRCFVSSRLVDTLMGGSRVTSFHPSISRGNNFYYPRFKARLISVRIWRLDVTFSLSLLSNYYNWNSKLISEINLNLSFFVK